jgi:hypothetical protein
VDAIYESSGLDGDSWSASCPSPAGGSSKRRCKSDRPALAVGHILMQSTRPASEPSERRASAPVAGALERRRRLLHAELRMFVQRLQTARADELCCTLSLTNCRKMQPQSGERMLRERASHPFCGFLVATVNSGCILFD